MRRAVTMVLCVALSGGALAGGRVIGPTPGGGTLPGQSSGSWPGRVLDGGRSLGQGVLGYVTGRVLDVLDIAELNVGVGLGLKAGVEYGLGRTTLGLVDAQRIGLDGRQAGTWFERNAAYGTFPVSLAFAPFELLKNQGDLWRAIAEGGFELGTVGIERTEREAFTTTTVLYKESRMAAFWHERPGDMCAIGGDAQAAILGVRARLKPVEVIDFLLGFVGVDLDRQLAHRQGRDAGGPGIDIPRTDVPAIRRPALPR